MVADTIARDFPSAGTSPLTVTAPASAAPAVGSHASELRGISGVLNVTPPAGLGHSTWQISVGVRGAPASTAAQALMGEVRARPTPFPVAVGAQPRRPARRRRPHLPVPALVSLKGSSGVIKRQVARQSRAAGEPRSSCGADSLFESLC